MALCIWSGSVAAQSSTPAATVAIVTAPPPAPSYTGEDLAAYNALNAARSKCGFGYLRQNPAIDHAVADHITWMVNNNTFSHFETPGTQGYDVSSRVQAAGYNYTQVGEVIAQRTGANKSGWGALSVRNLLAAPYHLMGMMDSNREIGVSVGSGATTGFASGRYAMTVIDVGASSAVPPQVQGAGDILTYPCQGVTNTAYRLSNESPNPLPGRDLLANPIGQPIFIQVKPGQTLALTTASITTTAGAHPVDIATTLTADTDPNRRLSANQAIIVPNAPMAPSTQYTVTINGTNNGANFTRQFTFTTDN